MLIGDTAWTGYLEFPLLWDRRGAPLHWVLTIIASTSCRAAFVVSLSISF